MSTDNLQKPLTRGSSHQELRVYRDAFDLAMELFRISKSFPKDELYSLTSQIRRSSRSVAANLSEAWRKRRYKAAFISKLSDAEAEAAETQTWLEFANACEYMDEDLSRAMNTRYEALLGSIVGMIQHADSWVFKGQK